MKLYTTGCPQCKVLKSKLDTAGINYEVVDDIDLMRWLGIASAPVLEVDGQNLNFARAIEWIKENTK